MELIPGGAQLFSSYQHRTNQATIPGAPPVDPGSGPPSGRLWAAGMGPYHAGPVAPTLSPPSPSAALGSMLPSAP